LFVLAISASAALAQRAISVQPGRYEIQIALTGKVLDLRQEDMRSVQQYYRGNVVNQQWDIESAGGNYYYIQSAQNGAYLGIEGTPREGARVVVTPGRQDMWRFVDMGNGNVMLIHRSGMVLDLTDGSNRDGTPMQVWSNAQNTHQQFKLLPINLAAANYNQRRTTAFDYNEAYRAGVNDREANLNQNYRRHRSMYDVYTERDFEQAYNAGYNSERQYDNTGRRRYDDTYNDDLSGMSQSERRVYDSAYQLGQRDARNGYSANYRRYSARYNSWQEDVFQRGYQAGYNSVNSSGDDRYNNDQFDVNSLTTYERRAYDEGYRLGQQDARYGYSLNYRRYANRITDDRLERFFQRGYEVGYNNTRRY
jgi:ribosome modulation factor